MLHAGDFPSALIKKIFFTCLMITLIFFLVAFLHTSQVSEMRAFFRTEKSQGRWWIIDTQGKKFISLGVNHVSFEGDYAPSLKYSPYKENVIKKYGGINAWASITAERLKKWGFNTIGAWSSPEMFNQNLVYTVILNFAESTGRSWLKGTFPDVFSKEFKNAVERRAENLCKRCRDDPLLLGYFLDNELRWAPDWRSNKHLLEDFLAMDPEAAGKQAAVDFLKERYQGRIENFNLVWDVSLQSFDEILCVNVTSGMKANFEMIQKDCFAFLKLVAHKYFEICVGAIKKYDPNHMVLGVRFAGYAPDEVVVECGRFCDIISFNWYGETPPKELLEHIYELTHKPIMITEFSFKAMDSGLPNTRGAGISVATQQDRADGYERYLKAGWDLPFIVGFHWFQYCDQPKEGRFDGENSNFGLVKINDEEWEILTERIRKVNQELHELVSSHR